MNYLISNPLIIVSIILVVIGISLWFIGSINTIKKDIKSLNLTVNKIANEIGLKDELKKELKNLILEDKKVEAIKRYRATTRSGLVEAKKYIDSLEK